MKKIIILIGIIGLFSLVGCSSNNEPKVNSSTKGCTLPNSCPQPK